jgi:hypothetical protein
MRSNFFSTKTPATDASIEIEMHTYNLTNPYLIMRAIFNSKKYDTGLDPSIITWLENPSSQIIEGEHFQLALKNFIFNVITEEEVDACGIVYVFCDNGVTPRNIVDKKEKLYQDLINSCGLTRRLEPSL